MLPPIISSVAAAIYSNLPSITSIAGGIGRFLQHRSNHPQHTSESSSSLTTIAPPVSASDSQAAGTTLLRLTISVNSSRTASDLRLYQMQLEEFEGNAIKLILEKNPPNETAGQAQASTSNLKNLSILIKLV